MKSLARILAALAVILGGPAAAQTPAPLQELLDRATADCRAFEDGMLTGADSAISRVDLTGDGRDDWVLDTSRLSCSSAASLFCGTGGCTVLFHADGMTHRALAKGWAVVEFRPLRVILLQVHGSECGGTNLRRCVEAIVVDEDGFQTIRPAPG